MLTTSKGSVLKPPGRRGGGSGGSSGGGSSSGSSSSSRRSSSSSSRRPERFILQGLLCIFCTFSPEFPSFRRNRAPCPTAMLILSGW